ncbi:MAG: pitrilysin family protein, partial [Syntrophaceae bacterium]|nr:pitrilysin family protein [Syntrophaceae bacterium]
NRFTLSNGLEVFVKEDHARKVAAIQRWVMVGSADEEPNERGLSHLLEHMAFKGTERRGVGKIAAEVEALGGEVNAYTSWDETVYFITAPSTVVNQALDILTDAVFKPKIDQTELEKEKQVVLEEILESEERPERKASKLLMKTVYTKSPYQFPIIGFRDTVEKISREDIFSFRKKWYVPENMFFLIVGDVDTTKLLPELEKLTEDLKPTGFFRPPRAVEPLQKQVRTAFLRDNNARETRLNIAFHIPGIKANDVNALDLAGDILGARDSSRLVKTLKKEKALVNSISAYALTPKDPGIMVVSATLEARNLEAVTRGIMEEISKLATEPPSIDELERAKVHIESQHIYARETVQGMCRSIGSFRADLGDAYYEEKYLTLIRAVTPEEISRVAKSYLFAPNATISVLLPSNTSTDFDVASLAQIVESFGTLSSGGDINNVGIHKAHETVLPNGIKVVLLRDDSNPAVSLRIAHQGGKRYETRETEGIMNFISQMLPKGAADLDETQLFNKVEDMGGRLAGFSGYDSFGLSATFFSRFLDQGLELLAKIHRDPTFPEDKLERERLLIINRIKTEPDRPIQYAFSELNKILFRDHPYGFNKEGTLATVAGFSSKDLRETYSLYAVPGNTVITVVGEMDPQKALKKISELFGTIPSKKLDAPKVPGEKPLQGVSENKILIPRAKAHIAIGFPAVSIYDPDRYPLEVLNNLLSGQGGRLFLQLRDRESLAYVVASFVRPGVDPGLFGFYIACDTLKVDKAMEGLFREIGKVRIDSLAEKEVKDSINNLVGNHLINLQSSWSRSENSALNTLYGLGYDYDSEYVKKISQVTPEDVKRVAQKYLDPEKCAILKILPDGDDNKS